MLLALIVGAAIAAVALVVVGSPFAKHSVTRAEIQDEVAKRPRGGKVQVVLCNQIVIPTQSGKPAPGQTWTCDTYLGPTKADAQNGPSYEVKVDGGEITSIRRVPTH
jgi:hypothetical protein